MENLPKNFYYLLSILVIFFGNYLWIQNSLASSLYSTLLFIVITYLFIHKQKKENWLKCYQSDVWECLIHLTCVNPHKSGETPIAIKTRSIVNESSFTSNFIFLLWFIWLNVSSQLCCLVTDFFVQLPTFLSFNNKCWFEIKFN